MLRFFAVLFLALLTAIPVFAEDFVFPVPKGTITVVNGYSGSPTHTGEKAQYSLDFQYLYASGPTTETFATSCYTLGMPVLAAKSGTVTDLRLPHENDNGYGYFTRIMHADGTHAWYGHMLENTVVVKMGETIKQGEILGLAGATGISIGFKCHWPNLINDTIIHEAPHVHLEFNTTNWKAIKPEPLVGAEPYENIVERQYDKGKITVQADYISTTVMLDPTNYWGTAKDDVPYVLPANAVLPFPRVTLFTPQKAIAEERQIFRVEGENLHLAQAIWIENCGRPQIIEHKSTTLRFACFPFASKFSTGRLEHLRKRIHRLELKDKRGGNLLYEGRFEVYSPSKVVAEEVVIPEGSDGPIFELPATENASPDSGPNAEAMGHAYLDYLLSTNPESAMPYSSSFLDSVGWKLVQGPDGKLLYEPIDCTDEMRKLPVILGVTGTACLGTL